MILRRYVLSAVAALGLIAACSPRDTGAPAQEAAVAPIELERLDRFTNANYGEVRVTHLALDLDVNFDDRVLDGTATLDFERLDPLAGRLVLDTHTLLIREVETQIGGRWEPASFMLGAPDPSLGAALDITLPEGAERVRISYRTSPQAGGLQWLSPEQTAGKEHPYMYSQAQALHARSFAPVQDTPAVRITYEAVLRTPPTLLALMSAEQDEGGRDGEYRFSMPQPIPSYLLAIAVGDIAFEPISDTIGVYAEDYIVVDAAREFEDAPAMERAAAALYGPYRWGRYDMLVLPPSFPYGGMENPRLTFLTPTLVAGDKSLTNVVAHELAHSWSGNLVTNATWRDAWLNEGFTSYVENRIMEEVYGRDRAIMEQALDLETLKRAIAEAKRPELTQLKMPDDLANPDEAFSQVSYLKGQFFLTFLEGRFGRDAFDAFLRSYFDHFAFQAITTEDFLAYFERTLRAANRGAVTDAEIEEWIYGPGLPATAPAPVSEAFDRVAAQSRAWQAGEIAADEIETDAWTTHEWLHFLNGLPDDLDPDRLAALDAAFSLSGTRNAETANAWYLKAIRAGYEPAIPELERFLVTVGRGKFIYRLYNELAEHDRKGWAQEVYAVARPGYHPIAQRRIDAILK